MESHSRQLVKENHFLLDVIPFVSWSVYVQTLWSPDFVVKTIKLVFLEDKKIYLVSGIGIFHFPLFEHEIYKPFPYTADWVILVKTKSGVVSQINLFLVISFTEQKEITTIYQTSIFSDEFLIPISFTWILNLYPVGNKTRFYWLLL